MAKDTAERIEELRKRAEKAAARLQAAEAAQAKKERALDTRRKIILGALLLDAATKDQAWADHLSTLLRRIDRPNDKAPFEGWNIQSYRSQGPEGARRGRQKSPSDKTESVDEEIVQLALEKQVDPALKG
jgi:hypothetical protein